ncbi:glycoside hydrolase [Intrasporangium oryzae NRRL B-24470]|uniref:Glycoside hydrolase n=1 Tax=Intrasporangium oryzae NRRL B-24470 TaxID=1386089 RepID=W9GA04_9MICO|nr:beta-N-acetylhexosaminidase [Intrasporangium oryzae]EWT02052.1 glycoside hydrolase [Intrasporangium oryzae NRRL B-24470]
MTTHQEALRRLVLGTLMPGFIGTTVPDWITREYAAGLASVCLYGTNVAGPGQLAQLCAELRDAAPNLILTVDEEGGDVTRLHYPTGSPQPGNALLGRIDDTALTRESAATIGRELTAYGINLDLAPVVDVNSADENPVIGVRSFGADAAHVARHTAAWIEGMQSAGVAACAKHFPGHGDTVTDSHLGLPRVDAPREVVEARELEPFRAAIAAGTACVMTSHVLVSSIDPDRPSTFSPVLLEEVLRGQLGFRGVIVTDALDMAGASAITGIPEAAVRALAAGCDLLCLGSETSEVLFTEVVEAILTAVESGRLPRERVEHAAHRVALLSGLFPPPLEGSPSEGAFAQAEALAGWFHLEAAAREWIADAAAPAIVQVDTLANLAVGHVAWGPEAAGLTVPEADVPAAAKVAVAARDLSADHPAWRTAERMRAAGHRTIVVECGWPRGGADLVTYGGSLVVGQQLGRLLGLGDHPAGGVDAG